ncbi:MAG TPA: NAD(P)-dependent oxidoreductase [Candidatus Fermentibacter daniensis]|nr:MAG: dTDP-4-dehydrorhamnose reductase [candidate division Hyd24-12 bacterium ADurb.Bin004]HOZ18523.1 NAD(P)-dependent oxidoreductase [Candidatus Fermentibacter daniensis]HPH40379.1 NAD(P)-dependent oxidoreductase [Candidatus Fermentibacter daniensis]HPN63486.1 NAD(P)-dependent oxidoreductase [Candidatus Fermentibacter daniensis]
MKAVVFGAGGMLGAGLCDEWEGRVGLIPLDHGQCDVCDRTRVREVLGSEKPDIAVLLAGATNVDRCETDPLYAFRANSLGPSVVSQVSRSLGVPVLFVSTIAVFDGDKTSPYTEFDDPSPRSVYGRSKLQGENAVRSFSPDHWIVRTGWLFGGGEKDSKFVPSLLRKAREGGVIRVVRDCVGSPTYTRDLAAAVLKLVDTSPFGLYHVVGGGPAASRFELAREVLEAAGYDPEDAVPCQSSEYPLPAPRPRMEAAESLVLRLLDVDLGMPLWRDSLKSYVRICLHSLLR